MGPTRKRGFEAEFCSLGTKNQPKNVADDPPHFTFIPHLLPLLSLFVSLLINCLSYFHTESQKKKKKGLVSHTNTSTQLLL